MCVKQCFKKAFKLIYAICVVQIEDRSICSHREYKRFLVIFFDLLTYLFILSLNGDAGMPELLNSELS